MKITRLTQHTANKTKFVTTTLPGKEKLVVSQYDNLFLTRNKRVVTISSAGNSNPTCQPKYLTALPRGTQIKPRVGRSCGGEEDATQNPLELS